jgi:uncharacterized protein YbbC (DUF1343 family)
VFPFRSQLIILIMIVTGGWWVTAIPQATSRHQTGIGPRLQTGIDVYESMDSEPFAGKRIGLITNQTGMDSKGRRSIDVFAIGKGVKLVALFSPEHGIAGKSEEINITDGRDQTTQLPIYSLYDETRRPTDEMLKGIDVLVFDIQDAGVRFYTYVTTMGYCMEAAAKNQIKFVVMDRPDPLGGDVIEGPMLDSGRTSFTAYFPMPVRYAMTIGELAKMFNAENHIGADLEVFPLRNWNRHETYDETGLQWIAPSPNLRTVKEAFLYPGLEILQAGGVSVGRGTDTPFEILGAPWIRADDFAAALNRRKIPGVSFESVQFTPHEDPYRGKLCAGVKIGVSDRRSLRTMRVGLEIADVLHRMYPAHFQLDKISFLLGSQSTIDRLKRGIAPEGIVRSWSPNLDKFRKMRDKYLLYH